MCTWQAPWPISLTATHRALAWPSQALSVDGLVRGLTGLLRLPACLPRQDIEEQGSLKLECDLCRCVVHMDCYGASQPPDGRLWLCDVCEVGAAVGGGRPAACLHMPRRHRPAVAVGRHACTCCMSSQGRTNACSQPAAENPPPCITRPSTPGPMPASTPGPMPAHAHAYAGACHPPIHPSCRALRRPPSAHSPDCASLPPTPLPLPFRSLSLGWPAAAGGRGAPAASGAPLRAVPRGGGAHEAHRDGRLLPRAVRAVAAGGGL